LDAAGIVLLGPHAEVCPGSAIDHGTLSIRSDEKPFNFLIAEVWPAALKRRAVLMEPMETKQ